MQLTNKPEAIDLFKNCCNNSNFDNYRAKYIKTSPNQNAFYFNIEGVGQIKIQGAFAKKILFLPADKTKILRDFDLTEIEYAGLKSLFNKEGHKVLNLPFNPDKKPKHEKKHKNYLQLRGQKANVWPNQAKKTG